MSERIYCCEQNLDEPLAGTADTVDVWVLLEYRPAWKAKAVQDNALDAATRGWLTRNLEELGAMGLKPRPQFVRRPELDSDEVQLLVGAGGTLHRQSGRGYGFLADVRLAEVVAGAGGAHEIAEPQYFVCTNGQRDVCCARFGLPVYAALRERVGGRVWQTTHLGGHRFAPNVLVLPQATLYGRVTEAAVDEFVARVEAGELDFPRLRGRTGLPPAAQAAEAFAGRSDLDLAGVDERGDGALVRFRAPGTELSVRVRQAAEPLEVLKSCGDEASSAVMPLVADPPQGS